MIAPNGPCQWPYIDCECTVLDQLATEGVNEVIAWASGQLWAATGKVFGPCPVSVLPCASSILCGTCHNTLRQCGCRRVPEIRLDGPVHEVDEVVIDGAALVNTAYRIEDYVWLVRTDGGTWPTNADPLDTDAFRVDYKIGTPPPAGAGLTTGILACELAKALCDDDSCRLPRRAQQVVRQGIQINWEPGEGFGLPEVDTWVENAIASTLAGAVHSPDFDHVRQITWTASPGSP